MRRRRRRGGDKPPDRPESRRAFLARRSGNPVRRPSRPVPGPRDPDQGLTHLVRDPNRHAGLRADRPKSQETRFEDRAGRFLGRETQLKDWLTRSEIQVAMQASEPICPRAGRPGSKTGPAGSWAQRPSPRTDSPGPRSRSQCRPPSRSVRRPEGPVRRPSRSVLGPRGPAQGLAHSARHLSRAARLPSHLV